MKLLWQKLGVAMYWLTWLGLWLVLRWSSRTRVAIINKKEILVVKPWLGNGKWGLPGGGVHRGEDMLESAIREVKEETNVLLPKNHCKLLTQETASQNGLHFLYALYICKIPKQVEITKQKREIIEAGWLPIKSLSAKNANQDVLTAVHLLK